MAKFHLQLRRLRRNTLGRLARRLSWCARWLPAEAPLELRYYECDPAAGDRLLVFLPGLGDVLDDYEVYGFIDAVRRFGIAADMAVADMHVGYYLRRSAVQRLREDIVLPARERGYREIDLVGISLGGFGALYYSLNHPQDIARLFLLAPYLGEPAVIADIYRAGGLDRWRPGSVADEDYQARLWLWLKGMEAGAEYPRLYLGYGLQDKFAGANQLLARRIPENRVHRIPGKHDWPTWIHLWHRMVPQLADRLD